MDLKVRLFSDPQDLCDFVNGGPAVTNVISILFDTTSGKYVVWYKE